MSATPALPKVEDTVPLAESTDTAGETERLQRLFARESLLHERMHILSEAERMAHFGVWSHDLALDRLEASDEAYRLFGLVPPLPGEVPPDFRTHLYNEDRQRIERLLAAAIETRKSIDTH